MSLSRKPLLLEKALLILLCILYSPFAISKALYLLRLLSGYLPATGAPCGRCADRGHRSKHWWGWEAVCPLCAECLGKETETKMSKCLSTLSRLSGIKYLQLCWFARHLMVQYRALGLSLGSLDEAATWSSAIVLYPWCSWMALAVLSLFQKLGGCRKTSLDRSIRSPGAIWGSWSHTSPRNQMSFSHWQLFCCCGQNRKGHLLWSSHKLGARL